MTVQTEQPILCRPHIRPAGGQVELSALMRIIAGKHGPAILGGNPSVRGVSIFAAEPVEVFEFHLSENEPFEKLGRVLSRYRTPDDTHLPAGVFSGGWIGFFGYELGRFIETLPQQATDDIDLPVIRLGFYDKAILYDHQRDTFSFVAVDMQGRPVEQKFAALADWFARAKQHPDSTESTDVPAVQCDVPDVGANMSQEQYFDALAQIHRHITDGDVYQINLSRRFSMPFFAGAAELFGLLNRNNPSPYAAYLAWGRSAVVSASPELFLEARGDRIRTCPIKGTRPRNGALPDEAPANRAQFNTLVQSEKDQAELAMIVDLLRNDLAQVCVPGSRYVSCARRIEAFPTVYHAVATIEGTLAAPPGPQRVEALLRATFPGGSITGAPKISAMEIIDALEPTARSVYTGAIGWIGLNFDLCLNIAIRTVLIRSGTAYVQTGGGIVADSDPQAEWDETLTKADALLACIQQSGKQLP